MTADACELPRNLPRRGTTTSDARLLRSPSPYQQTAPRPSSFSGSLSSSGAADVTSGLRRSLQAASRTWTQTVAERVQKTYRVLAWISLFSGHTAGLYLSSQPATGLWARSWARIASAPCTTIATRLYYARAPPHHAPRTLPTTPRATAALRRCYGVSNHACARTATASSSALMPF